MSALPIVECQFLPVVVYFGCSCLFLLRSSSLLTSLAFVDVETCLCCGNTVMNDGFAALVRIWNSCRLHLASEQLSRELVI